jgi:hypothetical protein
MLACVPRIFRRTSEPWATFEDMDDRIIRGTTIASKTKFTDALAESM